MSKDKDSIHKAIKLGTDFYIMSIKNDTDVIEEITKKVSEMNKEQLNGFFTGTFTAINTFSQILADSLEVEMADIAQKAFIILKDQDKEIS